jgi:hypothetical protein
MARIRASLAAVRALAARTITTGLHEGCSRLSATLTTGANRPKLLEPIRPRVTCPGEGDDMYGTRGSSPAP